MYQGQIQKLFRGGGGGGGSRVKMKGVQPINVQILKIYRGRPGYKSTKSALEGGGGGPGPLDPPPPSAPDSINLLANGVPGNSL